MQFRTFVNKKFQETVSRKDFEKEIQKIDLREILAHPDQDLEKLEKVRTLITRHGPYGSDDLHGELRPLIKVVIDAEDTEFLSETCTGYRLTLNGNEVCGGNMAMFYRVVPDKTEDNNLAHAWGEPCWLMPKSVSQETIAQCLTVTDDITCKGLASKIQKHLKSIGQPTCEAEIDEVFHKLVKSLPKTLPAKSDDKFRCNYRFSASYGNDTVPNWFRSVAGSAFTTEAELEKAMTVLNGGRPLHKDDYMRRNGGFMHNRQQVDAKLVDSSATTLIYFMRAKLYYAVLAELGLAITARRNAIKASPELLAAENTKKAIAKTDAILAVLGDLQKAKKSIDAIVRAIEIDSMTEDTLSDFRNQVWNLDRNARGHIAKLRKHYITPFKKR